MRLVVGGRRDGLRCDVRATAKVLQEVVNVRGGYGARRAGPALLLALAIIMASAGAAFAHKGHIYDLSFGSAGASAGDLSLTPYVRGEAGSFGSGVAVNVATSD